jgi:ribosome-associated protein
MIAKAETNRIEESRKFAIEAARLAAATHCKDLVVLDVRGISPLTDFLVIGTGTSAKQMRSVADDVTELAEKSDFRALSTSGLEGDSWIVTDFLDVIFHIFNPEARAYYELENLWGDARRVEWGLATNNEQRATSN